MESFTKLLAAFFAKQILYYMDVHYLTTFLSVSLIIISVLIGGPQFLRIYDPLYLCFNLVGLFS